MKFLTTMKMRESFNAMPGSVIRQFFQALVENMNRQKEAGKVLEIYFVPGWQHIVTISDMESAEALNEYCNSVPAAGFWEYEVYPLADFKESFRVILENLDAGDNMMPGGTIK